MNYLDTLNPEQRQAVENIDGPVMVIAGAGSGKTRVLTYRIAHMINQGVDPFRILALTFTNKAAKEMKERIANIVGPSESRNIWMGTFHSVFAKILRIEAERIGYPSNFTIYDTDDAKSLIKSILSEQGLDDKIYKPSLVLNRISTAKNNLISPAAYNKNTDLIAEDRMSAKPQLGLIYDIYCRRCFNSGAMDFDDLLFKTNVLLRDNPDLLNKYQDKFKYILVDEYQDTNYAQYLIVKKLAARFQNICVVGDDAQSIYAFRGANIQNILNFRKDYPDYKTFKLEQNYRSTQNIVNAANAIISHNQNQFKKDVWTTNPEGDKIKIFKALTDNEEGAIIAHTIFDLQMTQQLQHKSFAILYRTNAQSRALEEALRKMNIPYRIYGGLSFYKRKEIKDLIAYFRLCINPKDEEALKRVINYPVRGIGKTSLEKLTIAASEQNISLWDAIQRMPFESFGLGGAAAQKIMDFATMIHSFGVRVKTENAFDLANHIAQSSGLLKELFNDKTPEGVSRYDNIQELLNGIKEFTDEQDEADEADRKGKTLDVFLEDIALLTDDEKDDEQDKNRVSLMTIHAAKGLEFPYVFIAGLEENLFPSQLSLNSRDEMEEERRLFYVAVTRGEKGVYLSYAASRYKWGNLIYCEPSRFVEEIDPRFIEYAGLPPRAMEKKQAGIFNHSTTSKPTINTTSSKTPFQPPSNFVKVKQFNNNAPTTVFEGDDTRNLQSGMEVLHEKFGSGKVMTVEGTHPNLKATVVFPGIGPKQLLLKFAKLKILN